MASYISDIDSNRFGFKIAKIDNFIESPYKIVEDLRRESTKLIIARIDCEKIQLINQLEKLNFQTMDFQICYKYILGDPNTFTNIISSEFIIREAKKTDSETLKRIAKESFDQYGHYFADDRLDKKQCKKIYEDWINRSIENKEVADIVFVAEKESVIAGFLSFKIKKDEVFYAAGVQGAVDKSYRNKNIFKLLIIHGLKWGYELNLSWEEHNVLLTNYPVNRSFINVGFKPERSFITLHCWLD